MKAASAEIAIYVLLRFLWMGIRWVGSYLIKSFVIDASSLLTIEYNTGSVIHLL
jgi:hypothetical protein